MRHWIRDGGAMLLLLALTVLVFGQTYAFDFIDYDDGNIIFANPHIAGGLTWEGVAWAFTHPHHYLYMPITSLTHMLDLSLFGDWAGGHHLASVAYHGLAACLLYLALLALTGNWQVSLFVAAVFAIHPLRANSVAWLSTRKDPVSAIFFFLMLMAYVRYARVPSAGRYLAVTLLLVGGLLSKAILMTAPAVLLLLDWWPLNRIPEPRWRDPRWWRVVSRLVLEKVPLVLLSVVMAGITIWAERMDGERLYAEAVPLVRRTGDAVLNYVYWLGYMVAPFNLSIHYPPHSDGFAWWKVGAAFLLIAAITVLCLVKWRQRHLLVGWLWYLGILVPNVGFIRYGHAAFELRYTYLPLIGITLMIAWSAFICSRDWSATRRQLLGGVGIATVIIFTALGGWQVSFWRDTETIFGRAIVVTEQNDLAHKKVAKVLMARGESEAALRHYREAIVASPRNSDGYFQLGRALLETGNHAEAVENLGMVTRHLPEDADAQLLLGAALVELGRYREARLPLEIGLSQRPAEAGYWTHYGVVLYRAAELAKAEQAWAQANAQGQDASALAESGLLLIRHDCAFAAVPFLENALAMQPANEAWQTALDAARRATGLS